MRAITTPDATDLVFYLNGTRVQLANVDPTLLLVDYLRSPAVGLTGTKIGCKQGGCGACTVVLSQWNQATGKVEHRAINSCLRPLAALDGMLITTVEGTGSVKSGCISAVQNGLAMNNGTQCGYCTPGWVMNMTAAVAEHGPKPGTKAEIQDLFDGNLCRCTGYRPILYGMQKTFASDWDPAVDERGCMTCQVDPEEQVADTAAVAIAFPWELRKPPRAVAFSARGYRWWGPTTLEEARDLLREFPKRSDVRLVGGNTSIGVYPATVEDPRIFIDVSRIAALQESSSSDGALRLGSALSYQDLLTLLDAQILPARLARKASLPGLLALRYMAGRTAGTIVRQAATLAGNTMMVVRHIDEGVPFPSDAFTALAALGTRVCVLATASAQTHDLELLDFADQWRRSPEFRAGCLLLSYDVRLTTEDEYAQTYKTAQREVNAHSIVNAGMRVRLDASDAVADVTVVYGGLAPVAVRMPRTEAALAGQPWSEATLAAVLPVLRAEVRALIARHAARYARLPDEGFSDGYKAALAESFLYKFFIEVMQWRGLAVPPELRSASERQVRPVSRGTQAYASFPAEYPSNLPFIKVEAFLQVTGEARYTHDIALPPRSLNGAPVQSTVALGSCVYRVPGKASAATPAEVLMAVRERYPSVVDYITARDVPGPVFAGTAGDDPIFAVSVPESACTGGRLPSGYDDRAPVWLTGFGQCIGMVVAEDEQVAQAAAQYVQASLCAFTAQTPVLDIPDNDAARNALAYTDQPSGAPWYSHIWKITRRGSQLDWVPPRDPSQADPQVPVVVERVLVTDPEQGPVSCTRVSSTQSVGGQIHFYMETQSCCVEVLEDRQVLVHASTQDANSIQGGVAKTLVLPLNKVDVRVRRVGGGYGGKCGQSVFAAAIAAVGAWKLDRPVRMAALRQVDSAMFGHRHPAIGNYSVAIGDASDPANYGRLLGYAADYWLDGGRTYDCSFVISDCLSLRSDSAYRVPNWICTSDVCRTNKTTNTSMRTVGMIQAAVIAEDAIEAAAHSVGLRADEVRARNLYRQGDTTPYGEPLDSCYMQEVYAYALAKSEFRARQAAVDDFNAKNRWRKRGISLIPVKYGSGFNLTMLEQGGALIEVYDQDGTVLVRHGGIEMGQGLNTKMAQVVALALNVPMGCIRVAENDTAVVPNPESTGASTGTSFNGDAAQKACNELRERLEQFCLGLLRVNGAAWCQAQHLDFWSYPEGWRAQPEGSATTLWQNIVRNAFDARVNLSAQARVRVPGGSRPDTGLTFKTVDGKSASEPVDYFTGYTYSAACTEVEIDVLTGETTLLRSDIVYDAGRSLNPALDIGQVEGGFVQGLGYVISEELVYQPAIPPVTSARSNAGVLIEEVTLQGNDVITEEMLVETSSAPSGAQPAPAPGALYTVNTWEYKPPAAQSIPLQLNVMLFPRELAPFSPPDKGDVLSAKEIGEPPMTLAVTAFFAIKQAVLAARKDAGHTGWFQMAAPATVQRVREACAVTLAADSGEPPKLARRESAPSVEARQSAELPVT